MILDIIMGILGFVFIVFLLSPIVPAFMFIITAIDLFKEREYIDMMLILFLGLISFLLFLFSLQAILVSL